MMWMRGLIILFMVSWTVETARLLLDDQADYLAAVNNPPKGCIDETSESTATAIYNYLFEAPIKTDCVEFFRRTHPLKLYLPRFPQALANVLTHIILTPFEVFLDRFGDALRHFMNKFNMAERFIGVIVLLVMTVLMTVGVGFLLWFIGKSYSAPIQYVPQMIQDQSRLLLK